ncbi:calcium-binding protein, partial [Vibrio sp. J1-1]|nr:calcium-binding protein [Vibrio sp. J1-1]
MDRLTLSSLVGNIVVIGLDGNIRTLAEGEFPKPGELIIEEVSDTSELVVEQVTPQGSSINVTDDITALIEAIAQGQDPTQLGEDFETAAGGVNGSSPQTTGAINRTGAESLASTNFETVGINGTGFSSTQVQTLLDIFQPQAPAPQEAPLPAEVVIQEISSPTVNEGEQVTFDVTLDQATEIETNIELSLDDGSAIGGSAGAVGVDFDNTNVLVTLSDGTTQEIQVNEDGTFTVSLPIGVQSFTVSLDSVADDIYEGPETFTLTGATPDQTTPASGTATILDDGTGPGANPDDDRPTLTVGDSGLTSEGEAASFEVSLSNPVVGSITYSVALDFSDLEENVAESIDFPDAPFVIDYVEDGQDKQIVLEAGESSFTLPGNVTEFTVQVATEDDDIFEGVEGFKLNVVAEAEVGGEAFELTDSGLGSIIDERDGEQNGDTPTLVVADAVQVEEGNAASFDVSISNAV